MKHRVVLVGPVAAAVFWAGTQCRLILHSQEHHLDVGMIVNDLDIAFSLEWLRQN